MRIQIGYEHFDDNGKRDIRITPIDQLIKGIPAEAQALLGIILIALDAKDTQPGDGEVDIALSPALMDRLRKAIPVIGTFLPVNNANAFLRIRS